MELNILSGIQSIHNPVPDRITVFFFDWMVGSKGEFRILLGTLVAGLLRKVDGQKLLSKVKHKSSETK